MRYFFKKWCYNVIVNEVTDNGKPQETVGRKAKGAKTKVMPARPPNISDQAFFERGILLWQKQIIQRKW